MKTTVTIECEQKIDNLYDLINVLNGIDGGHIDGDVEITPETN